MAQAEDPRSDLPASAPPLLETAGVSKTYPGVLALDRVDFDLRAGEVHILFGENGAGKSTLISILAGVQPPSAGEVGFRGEGVAVGGHIPFGENGAGKSTLISILAGVQTPSAGEVRFRGERIAIESVHQARPLGISPVFQGFSLGPP